MSRRNRKVKRITRNKYKQQNQLLDKPFSNLGGYFKDYKIYAFMNGQLKAFYDNEEVVFDRLIQDNNQTYPLICKKKNISNVNNELSFTVDGYFTVNGSKRLIFEEYINEIS